MQWAEQPRAHDHLAVSPTRGASARRAPPEARRVRTLTILTDKALFMDRSDANVSSPATDGQHRPASANDLHRAIDDATPGSPSQMDDTGQSDAEVRRRSRGHLSRARASLGRTARRQHGVFTSADARAAGVSSSALSAMVRSGVVIRRYRGVYVFSGAPDSRDARLLAAVLSLGSTAVLSHQSAATLHDLDHGVKTAEAHVRTSSNVRGARSSIVVHQGPPLPQTSVTRVRAIPVTTVSRTLCDLAGSVDEEKLREMVADAVRRGVASTRSLLAEVEARQRFAGRGTLRGVLAALSPLEPDARGQLESAFLALSTRAGMPPTALNYLCIDARGQRRRLDAVWLPEGVAVELDSRSYHGTLIDYNDDLRRENAILLGDIRIILRFSYDDVMRRPDDVVETLRCALVQARAELPFGT